MLRHALLGAAVAAALVPSRSAAQEAERTSADGVYTQAQAREGKDLFAGYCQSCHTPAFHAGDAFKQKWYGRSLGELFGYLRREMPKTEPGSMSDDEYATVLAYLLSLNGMPAGRDPLAGDSTALHRIRLDSVTSRPTPPGNRR